MVQVAQQLRPLVLGLTRSVGAPRQEEGSMWRGGCSQTPSRDFWERMGLLDPDQGASGPASFAESRPLELPTKILRTRGEAQRCMQSALHSLSVRFKTPLSSASRLGLLCGCVCSRSTLSLSRHTAAAAHRQELAQLLLGTAQLLLPLAKRGLDSSPRLRASPFVPLTAARHGQVPELSLQAARHHHNVRRNSARPDQL